MGVSVSELGKEREIASIANAVSLELYLPRHDRQCLELSSFTNLSQNIAL